MPNTDSRIKDRAKILYVADGLNANEISRHLAVEFEHPVPSVTITSWINGLGWKEHREEADFRAMEKLKSKREDIVFSRSEKQKEYYSDLADKAADYLELDNKEHQISWDEPDKAVKALDVAIKGEREVDKGLVNIEFATTLLEIIQEEIFDTDVIQRLGIRFREAAQKFQID